MTYDIRKAIMDAIEEGMPYHEGTIEEVGAAADLALDVIGSHLANEPRTKAETALIEFAEGKARTWRDNGFLRRSDAVIPREILQAFVEELK